MAHTLTPKDVHVLIDAMAAQMQGQGSISSINTSDFVSAGETMLTAGLENTLNAFTMVIGRTFAAVRPYKAKGSILDAIDTGAYTDRFRKISFYSRLTQPSGDWNTQLFTNLYGGYDNGQNPNAGGTAQSTKSMWEQNPAIPLELNFSGRSVWEDSNTIYKYQWKNAFRSEEEFARIAGGIMTEKGNDIEMQKEAFNRLAMLNLIAGTYDMNTASGGTRVVNLTAAYNARFGTSYTSAQLRSTYLRSFLEFMVATIKQYSDRLERRSVHYHWYPAKTDAAGNNVHLLRHTPKSSQKLALYGPLFKEAEAMVMPEIFNPRYLSLDNYESFDYWQYFDDNGASSAAINVTPAIPNTSNPSTQTAGSAVSLDYVVGILFDRDACMVDYQLDDAEVTPIEARKRYYNMWWSFAKNIICDFTENSVIFTMEDA